MLLIFTFLPNMQLIDLYPSCPHMHYMQVLYTAEVVGNQCKALWFGQFSLESSLDTLWAENTHTPVVGCHGDGMTHRRCFFAIC